MTPQKIIRQYEPTPENLLSILHDLQDANVRHYLTDQDLQLAAGYLRLPFSFVQGVATFYTMFRLTPRGKSSSGFANLPLATSWVPPLSPRS